MLHLSIAWFALLLAIGAWILVGDYVKYLKFQHDQQEKKAVPTPKQKVIVPGKDVPVPA